MIDRAALLADTRIESIRRDRPGTAMAVAEAGLWLLADRATCVTDPVFDRTGWLLIDGPAHRAV